MLFGLFLFLFFLVKGVSGRPSFLKSLVTDRKLPRRSARVLRPRQARCLTASMRSDLPADLSKTSKEVNPIRLSAVIMIKAQPGRVLFSRCSSKMFLSRATLEPWCLEVKHGIESPTLLCGRYLLLPFIIFLLWANLSTIFCIGAKSLLLSGKAVVQWCSLEEIKQLEFKLRTLIVSFLALLSKYSIMLVIFHLTNWSFALAPDRRSCGWIEFPRKVKLSEKLSLLRPYASRLAMSSCEKVKFMGIILDFAGDILRPETKLKRLKRSSILVMLVLSL